jgi:hypothetical protein
MFYGELLTQLGRVVQSQRIKTLHRYQRLYKRSHPELETLILANKSHDWFFLVYEKGKRIPAWRRVG